MHWAYEISALYFLDIRIKEKIHALKKRLNRGAFALAAKITGLLPYWALARVPIHTHQNPFLYISMNSSISEKRQGSSLNRTDGTVKPMSHDMCDTSILYITSHYTIHIDYTTLTIAHSLYIRPIILVPGEYRRDKRHHQQQKL